jgi:hypothetical protein
LFCAALPKASWLPEAALRQVVPMTTADVPLQAQVLLLTRFPYLTDAQRTEVLACA